MRFVLAITALAFIATPAAADWNYTRWRMTPAEVVEASGGTAILQDRVGSPGQTPIKVVGTQGIDGMPVAVIFMFDQGQTLSMVQLQGTPSQCGRILTGLSGKYGRAERAFPGFARWRSDADNVSVDYNNNDATGCIVTYQPLRLANSAGL